MVWIGLIVGGWVVGGCGCAYAYGWGGLFGFCVDTRSGWWFMVGEKGSKVKDGVYA